ncbi:MAG TPA: hypothetical protein VHA06_00065 [Candidatus Angelobacter sp.]|nr:hypothetical protein [Candidatus Angelobacter sp.]
MPFTVTDCIVDTNSITIIFSDPVDNDSKSKTRANNSAHYTVFDPGSVDFIQPTNLHNTRFANSAALGSDPNTVMITCDLDGKKEFQSGDWVTVVVKGIKAADGTILEDGIATIARQVPGKGKTARLTRDVEDAISYPILTEEVGYRSSPVGLPSAGGSGSSGGGGLGQVAAKAVSDVLGWKTNSTDPKGFVGALTQAFTLTDVEGHVESTWTPRTYAVQTDLGGGITGAQASLYMRAKNALDSALPLLDGLYPLNPEADPEYVKATREMARSQMTEIIKELGTVGLPSILRIDTYFGILLGKSQGSTVQFDPDKVTGTLGKLRDIYGIYFNNNPFNNSVEDEQDITNFRVISDYMTSLMQSWIANRNFFRLGTSAPAFFGTQLVLISRQFTVIAETVNEVRFALDSVFIGPNERQALLLEFTDQSLAPMFLEDVLNEVESFASDEGPRLLRDGGKISVTNNILPVVQVHQNLVEEAHEPLNINVLPGGFKTARVRNSLDDLNDQLEALVVLIQQVEQQGSQVGSKFALTGIKYSPAVSIPSFSPSTRATLSIFGNGIEPPATVSFTSESGAVTTGNDSEFYSSQRIDCDSPKPANYVVTVTNPNNESATLPITVTGSSAYINRRVTVNV